MEYVDIFNSGTQANLNKHNSICQDLKGSFYNEAEGLLKNVDRKY